MLDAKMNGVSVSAGGCPILAEQGWGTDGLVQTFDFPTEDMSYVSVPHPSLQEGWGTQRYRAAASRAARCPQTRQGLQWHGDRCSIGTNPVHLRRSFLFLVVLEIPDGRTLGGSLGGLGGF